MMSFEVARMDHQPRVGSREVYRWDLLRGAGQGVIETGLLAFTILIAIRMFDASGAVKGLLASATFLGLFLTPIGQQVVAHLGISVTKFCGGLAVAASGFLLISGWVPHLSIYVVGVVVAAILFAQMTPLITPIYVKYYRVSERSSLVANTLVVAVLVGAVAGLIGGWILDVRIEWYSWVVTGLAVAGLISGVAFLAMPPATIKKPLTRNPLQNLGLIRKDLLFAWFLAGWMLLGVANLMLVPLRIDYLADEKYGINLSNSMILLLTVGVYAVSRVLAIKLAGLLFYRMDFIHLRNLLNGFFLTGSLIYFNSTAVWSLALGSFFFGLGMGGGAVTWSLWVTKLAPEEEVSNYMSVHTGMTGFRGILAPFLGYALLEVWTPAAISYLAAGLMAAAMVMFQLTRWYPDSMRRLRQDMTP